MNDASTVQELLGSGIDPDCRDELGRTPLHWACQEGKLEIVKCLLNAGASIDVQDNGGFTPLYTAVGEGNLGITRELLERNASPTLRVKSDGDGTPLHSACAWGHFDIVKLLVDKKQVDINAKDEDRQTPLFFAKKGGFKKIADYLIRHGAKE
jgi:ankyrin repeat protein